MGVVRRRPGSIGVRDFKDRMTLHNVIKGRGGQES